LPWVEISIRVRREDVPLAEQALEALGSLAVTLQDDADNPVLEPDPGATPLWPTVQVCGLFDTRVARDELMSGLQAVPGADRPGNLGWRQIEDQDWERAWLDRFQPMQFGRRLWIVPGGMVLPPHAAADSATIGIRLDPGLAFGTGTHPTTALCLEWIDGHEFGGASVVDYGCGSGILAIAAALKGAARVRCVDTDPQALQATAENARRNAVEDRLECLLPDEFADDGPGADVVLANILARPLEQLAPRIAGVVRPGGAVVLSGILDGQQDSVARSYAPCCEHRATIIRDDWVRLDLVRR
jgi:ribosomal protein L11 methyltransferase